MQTKKLSDQEDKYHFEGLVCTKAEQAKVPKRTEVINYLLGFLNRDTSYLEIGVRDPRVNFDLIQSSHKYGVDPGSEVTNEFIDFEMTSDLFFKQLDCGDILIQSIRFDVIFIDGLHLADQVDRDIDNAFRYLRSDGFIVLHDCNPPTEWHARYEYNYIKSPAMHFWNGTTWKAFMKRRYNPSLYSCCIDTDWGVGILSKAHPIGRSIPEVNPFYEYPELEKNRKYYLNLIDFPSFVEVLEKRKP